VNPNPTITVNSAAICLGNNATLTASGASSYTWSTGSGGSSIVVTPTATSQYTVWGSSGTCSSSSTATVSIIPGPTLTINPLQICKGQSGTLVATGATSYTWNTGANSSSISVNPTVNTTYTLIGSNGTCTSQVTSQVTVNPNPTITVSSATVCSGSNATLIASGASSYTWSTGSGGSSVVVNPTTQTVYTVSGTNSFGCNSSATATVNITSSPTLALNATLFNLCGNQQATIMASSNYTNFSWSTGSTNSFIIVNTAGVYQVTVSSPCGSSVQSATVTIGNAPVFTIVPSSSLLCTGQTITLSTTGSSGTLQWSNGSGSSSITINQSGIYTATLSNACGSATQSIAINDGPSTSLNIISSSPTLCAGDQVTVTANGTGTINWSTGANNTSSIIVNTQGVYTASLSNYCGTAVQQITLYPGPSPDVTIAATSTAICNNGASTLTAFGNAPASYSWAGISSGSTLVVTSPGTYSAIAYNNCGVSMATIQISQPAAPLLTVTPTSTILCSGGQVTLTANGLNGNNSYTWNTTPSSSNTFVVTTPGTYSVTYGNACASITQTIDIVPSAVSASISANPSSGYPPLVVSFSNFSSGNVTNVWNLGNGNTSTLNIPPGQQYTSPGIYTITLLVSDANGCTSVASVTIEVLDTPFGIIPELVTPDGDGKNDVFEIKGIEKYPNNEIEIYNRWGNLVYKKSGYKNERDGRPNVTSMGKDRLPSATYFYILKLNDTSQTIYKGFVVLMY
jgi:gliding motility-associated-like protein